jgi:hypothetical protein
MRTTTAPRVSFADDEADPGEPATLYIKQARPYPGRG